MNIVKENKIVFYVVQASQEVLYARLRSRLHRTLAAFPICRWNDDDNDDIRVIHCKTNVK